jgi:hypothetical protein
MLFVRTAAVVAIAIISTIAKPAVRTLTATHNGDLGQKNAFQKCRPDPDARYRREQILDQMAGILKQSIPKDAIYYSMLHSDWEGNKLRFFVYDLTDPTNIHPEENKRGPSLDASCIRFLDHHVYHFAPFFIPYSFSHLAFLENGKLKVFKVLNCEGKGDSLDDVVAYLEQKLKADKQKDEVIGRVKDYRKFGYYFTVDDTYVRCGEVVVQPKGVQNLEHKPEHP